MIYILSGDDEKRPELQERIVILRNTLMQSTQITPEIKAFLISIGSVSVDPLLIPRARGSTAGPGAGTSSVFFRAGGKRVRLSVNKNSPLSIAAAGDSETVALLHEAKNLPEENLNLHLHIALIRLLSRSAKDVFLTANTALYLNFRGMSRVRRKS